MKNTKETEKIQILIEDILNIHTTCSVVLLNIQFLFYLGVSWTHD